PSPRAGLLNPGIPPASEVVATLAFDPMTNPAPHTSLVPIPPDRTGSVRTSLRSRIRVYAAIGLLVIGGWLYVAVHAVLNLYDATNEIARYTALGQRVSDALGSVREGTDSLDRYVRQGQGYDLSQHEASRTAIRTSLGAIRLQPLTVTTAGTLRQAEAASQA